MDLLLIHNRTEQTILEKSLAYLGILDHAVVRPHLPHGVWRNTYKIPAALHFAETSTSEFVFCIDADDSVLIGDPRKALELLEDSGGDILFSTTGHGDYDLMPDIGFRFLAEAETAGWGASHDIHLNAGVYVARRRVLVEFLRAATRYVSANEPMWSEYRRAMKAHPLDLPPFPFACGSEQNIFRFIYPAFSASVRLDYNRRLAYR
ncbi:hypothetical protein [Mesorhizobium sp. ES1-1]|uniref:hypothetical protein n=1 Tax=Mesorhizobium sp. ES1-1 TaxID=2876629 RepID=UPI001CC9283C|nr:hypothetical protein [Mesorhizobium sp. ES1-1]MBZ9678123.1 hypothetical protein [Mesorhizobium sp. ES1-1]